MKVKERISRLLGIVLAVSLGASFLPGQALGDLSSSAAGTCVHHPNHTEDCGYAATVEGSSCSYEAEGCPYCVVSWEWIDDQGALSWSDGIWGIGLAGANESNPVTRDVLASLLPSKIVAATDAGEEKELDIAWDLGSIPEEGVSAGDYPVTAHLVDANYALSDGASPLAVTVQAGGAESYDLTLPSGTPPYPEHIVDGVSPNGTTINLFDYWITEQTASDNVLDDGYMNLGINKNHALLFSKGNKEASDWNKWTGSKNPYIEIVGDDLQNGYPALNNLDTDEASGVSGRDGSESLAYLFDPSISHEGKASYRDVQGLLQVDDDGYYYYNSQKNYAAYYANAKSFALYEHPGVKPGGTSPVGQFFPFNEATANAESASYKDETYTLMNTRYSTDSSINHYFGMHMSTRFIQQNGGYTGELINTPVTYEFAGDDDVWIFIDGKLVGDLGGIHDAASISIDFSTGKIKINDTIQSETLGQILGLSTDTLTDDTYHTLDFFYLERGNTDSNMYLKYNLVTIPTSGLIKVDQLGDAVQGAEFTLYGARDYEANGSDATPVATGSTDVNGQFVFLTQEAAGGERPITVAELYAKYKDGEDNKCNNLILVETETPPGYRSCGEIGLYFDDQTSEDGEVLLLASEDSIWGQGAYAMPKVTVTTANSIQLLENASDVTGVQTGETIELVGPGAVENPLMFAVVFQKQDDGSWLPVSGDPLNGWKVWNSNDWASILGAAQATPHIFQLASGGAFQVEIEDLPGNIQKYYHLVKNKDEAQYTIGYYYSKSQTLAQTTQDNTFRINSESTDSSTKLDRVFSVNLYVTDMKNRLLVQKVDEDGNEVNGAEFSLYKADDVTVTTNGDGTMVVAPVENAHPARAVTQEITMPMRLSGAAVFPDSVEGNGVLEKGEYWLVETSAPIGYKAKTDPVHVIVDDTGVYADAGTADDGVTVLRGVGSVARSMIQFVVDDNVDITLRDIQAALAKNVSYSDADKAFSWEVADWDASDSDAILNLTYTNSNKMLDYGIQGSAEPAGLDDLTLPTDVGWSKLLVRQDYDQGNDDDKSLKTDLGGRDITNLFSGTVTVRVVNDKTGNLKISKEVTGDGAPASQKFTFSVTVTDNGTPLSGTYRAIGGNNMLSSVEFNEGTAEISLKDDESLTILALPAGANFTVEETSVFGYTPSVSVTGDENAQALQPNKATGTIQHNVSEDEAVLTAFTNDFDGSVSVELEGTKTLQGRHLAAEDSFTFNLEAADDDTKQAIDGGRIVMPGSVSDSISGDGSSSVAGFSFGSVRFMAEGTYKFNITEQLPSGVTQEYPISGDVWYDTHTTSVTVTVTRNGTTGFLEANVSYDNSSNPGGSTESEQAVFVNRWGGLEIAKMVTGSMGDRDKLFDFAIEVKDSDGNGLTGSYPCAVTSLDGSSSEIKAIEFTNGAAGFQLKHGQTMTVYGLPADAMFTLSEPNAQADGYTTTVTSGSNTVTGHETSGALSSDGKVSVTFENNKGGIPATGIFLDVWPWALAAVLFAALGTTLVFAAKWAQDERCVRRGKHVAR